MSTTRSIAESEGDNDSYDELYEDWYSYTDYSSSSLPLFSTASPSLAYLVIKRQTYPHWEKDALKDHVVVQLRGTNKEPGSDSKSNNGINADRGPTSAASRRRIHVPDSAALSTHSTEEAEGEAKNARRAPMPAPMTTGAYGSSSSSQLCAPSSDQPLTLFASFAPPHLPPATQFPPLDPRAQLLLEKSKEEARRRQQEQQGIVPTFSFSKLQTMVADSATRSHPSPILSHLTGLHNQVQGSPQSPSLWQIPLVEGETEVKERPDSFVSARSDVDAGDVDEIESTTVSTKATEDYSEESMDHAWPIREGERFLEVKHAFDDSFIPDCHSSMLSGSSANEQSHHDASTGPKFDYDLTPGSGCTCGHKKHYVRPVQSHEGATSEAGSANEDSGRDFSFYFRSESRHGSSDLYRKTPSDHRHPHSHIHHTREFTDTNIAMENYAGSERSTRADAGASHSSFLGLPPDSRTSSELYLSPNFPDADSDDRHDFGYSGGVVLYSAPDSDGYASGREGFHGTNDDEDGRDDSHRVYFPTQSAQATSSPAPFSTLRRLVTATRRRVTSISGAAFGFASISRRQSQSQSQPHSQAQMQAIRPTTIRSAPSAKAELERGERPQKVTTTTVTATADSTTKNSGSSARKRNVLTKRGRSSTVRPVGFRRSTFHARSGMAPPPPTRPASDIPNASNAPIVPERTGDQRPGGPQSRRTSGRFSFIRRFSHFGRPSHTDTDTDANTSSDPDPFGSRLPAPQTATGSGLAMQPEAKPELGPEITESAGKPGKPAQSNATPSHPRAASEEREEAAPRARTRRESGAAVLFRRFSLASPRTPGSNTDRMA